MHDNDSDDEIEVRVVVFVLSMWPQALFSVESVHFYSDNFLNLTNTTQASFGRATGGNIFSVLGSPTRRKKCLRQPVVATTLALWCNRPSLCPARVKKGLSWLIILLSVEGDGCVDGSGGEGTLGRQTLSLY